MLIQHLKNEMDALKAEVAELRSKGVEKVLVSTLDDLRATTEDLHRRVTNLEMFLSKSSNTGAL